MRLIVSGDRNGYVWEEIVDYLDGYRRESFQLVVVEGCADGVDTQAETWALSHGAVEVMGRENKGKPVVARLVLEHWPAQWRKHGMCWCGQGRTWCNYAGHRRNIEMADSGVNRVVAFHSDISRSKGTKAMIEEAQARSIPHTIVGSRLWRD